MSLCSYKDCKETGFYRTKDSEDEFFCHLHKTSEMEKIKNSKCIGIGCNKYANYNYEGETYRLYCSSHAKKTMINVGEIRCKYSECNKKATHGKESREYCKEHSNGLSNQVKRKLCIIENCKNEAKYNYKNKPREYCSEHLKTGMCSVRRNLCEIKDCLKMAYFNFENKKKPIRCSIHSELYMRNIISKRCIIQKCDNHVDGKDFCLYHSKNKTPVLSDDFCCFNNCNKYYTFVDKSNRKYCNIHKTLESTLSDKFKVCSTKDCSGISSWNYSDRNSGFCEFHIKNQNKTSLNNNICIIKDCFYRAKWGLPNKKYSTHCTLHCDTSNMVIKLKYVCIVDSCFKSGNYFTLNKEFLYCKEHSPETSELVTTKCKYEGCTKYAYYGVKGTKEKEYCSSHKNPKTMCQIFKECSVNECLNVPRYGLPQKQPTLCLEHGENKEGYIKDPRKRCKEKNCNTFALYGINSPLHCEIHKKPKELNLIERKCVSCELFNVLNHEDKCRYCGDFSQFRLFKQNKVKMFLDKEKIKYDSYDKIIDQGICGKERPDFLIDCNTHFIILEVDESQHKGSKYNCENVRMQNLTYSLGLPVIFIRYNPDSYICEKELTEIQRHNLLKKMIKELKKNTPKELLTVYYICYNNFIEKPLSEMKEVIELKI